MRLFHNHGITRIKRLAYTNLTAGNTARSFCMKRSSMFMTGMLAVLLTFGLVLAGCDNGGGGGGGGGGGSGSGGGGFTVKTNNSIANDLETLGLVGEQVTSRKPNIATAKIADGKIVITSVGPGSATIEVTQATYTADVWVTVAADGGIRIDHVVPARGPRPISFIIKSGEHTIEGVKIQVSNRSGGMKYTMGSDSAYGENTGIAAGEERLFGPFTIEPNPMDRSYVAKVTAKVEGLTSDYVSPFNCEVDSREFLKRSYTLIFVQHENEGGPYYVLEEE
jgi:hypothetical protein